MSLLKSTLDFLGMKLLAIASLVLQPSLYIRPSSLRTFFIVGNRSPSNVDTPFRDMYTEINTDSFATVDIDGNKGRRQSGGKRSMSHYSLSTECTDVANARALPVNMSKTGMPSCIFYEIFFTVNVGYCLAWLPIVFCAVIFASVD